MKLAKSLVVFAVTGGASLCHAQSSVSIYGLLDEYVNYMKSSSGTKLKGLEDGGLQRSRLGFRGNEDLDGGYRARFVLEMGLNANNGTGDATRSFDRQTYVGLVSPYGELRLGRQQTAIFFRGDYMDYTGRTLGSIMNDFGNPTRYDNDIAYLSPRVAGFLLEAHYSLSETTAGVRSQGVYQLAADYLNGPFRVGYAGWRAKPPVGAVQSKSAAYDTAYGNYDYGSGRVYLAYVRSNNSTANAISNNAGTLVSNVGGLLAGKNADVNRYYNIVQVSADYHITPMIRVGALWGRITDTADSSGNANGGSIGGFYDFSKRTTVYGMVDTLRNSRNAGFRPAGSSALPFNFSTPNDINGRTINGVQLGLLHRF